jgi:hypothetical protein
LGKNPRNFLKCLSITNQFSSQSFISQSYCHSDTLPLIQSFERIPAMQCAYCGAALKPGSKVCEACGAEVAPANPPGANVSEDPIPEAFPYVDPAAQGVEPPVEAPASEGAAYTPATFAEIAAAAEKAPPIITNPPPVMAIISLVLGILSLCGSFALWCGAPMSIIGMILGFLSLKKSSTPRGLAIGGIATSAVGLILAVLITIVRFIITLRSGN